MNSFMTTFANRNNIEPMFRFIRPMVILFCLLAAGAPIMKCWEQFACMNSVIDFASSLCLFGIVFIITSVSLFTFFGLIISLSGLFAFFALVILLLVLFVFFGLMILVRAVFASRLQAVTVGAVFMKLRQWKDFLAVRALFCLNGIRHFFFLNKKLCLEPSESYTLSCGSFYYNSICGEGK